MLIATKTLNVSVQLKQAPTMRIVHCAARNQKRKAEEAEQLLPLGMAVAVGLVGTIYVGTINDSYKG